MMKKKSGNESWRGQKASREIRKGNQCDIKS